MLSEMTARFQYKPPFGLDIRVKPHLRAEEKRCEWPNCAARAETRAPKSPNALKDYHWFCPNHAREYNRSWNYFEGMNDEEVRRYQENDRYGHRPTWTFDKNGRGAGRSGGREEAKTRDHAFADPFDLFGGGAAGRGETDRRGRTLSNLQKRAFETFDLEFDAKPHDIKKRYAELVKRFHPDANKGARNDERRLQRVIEAYKILKTAGFC